MRFTTLSRSLPRTRMISVGQGLTFGVWGFGGGWVGENIA